MIRFVHFFGYPSGVSIDAGENWYLQEQVPKLNEVPGLRRHLSWRGLEAPDKFSGGLPTPPNQLVRRSELWFDDLSSAQPAVLSNSALWERSAATAMNSCATGFCASVPSIPKARRGWLCH